jgi:hypothetical protein
MPTCPRCKKKIDHIVRVEKAFVSSRLFLDRAGKPSMKQISFEPDVVDFQCPKCETTIADFEEDAVKILKGEPIA